MKFIIIALLFNITLFAKVQTLYNHKGKIWGMTKTDNQHLAFTTIDGGVFLLNIKTKKATKLKVDFPGLLVEGQGGLLDIYFFKNKLYFTYSFKSSKGNTTRLASYNFEKGKLTNFKALYTANAFESTTHHYGSRIHIFEDKIYFTVGDRGKRDKAQLTEFDNGSIIRLNLDGSIPDSNPIKKNAIYSFGHRNSQGITSHEGIVYNGEFGPQGGDEINLIQAGKNYGWPIITYGEEYGGGNIGSKIKEGFVQPLKFWVPSLSFSEIIFNKNKLYLACLGSEKLVELEFKDKKLINQKDVSENLKERFRTLEVIDEKVYFATDAGTIGFIL